MNSHSTNQGLAPPSLTDIRYFLAVASTGNLSRAAERLSVRQSTLSIATRRLETILGVALFTRGKSGVRLTKAGHRLAAEARQLLEAWERIATEVPKDETEVRGRFSIGCHEAIGLYALPKVVPRLLQAHPSLELTIRHDYSRRVTEDVVSYRLDFALAVDPVRHPDLVIRPLYDDALALWTAPSVRRAPPPVLIYDPDTIEVSPLLVRIERAGLSFEHILPASSLEMVASLTRAGAGVGILPGQVAERDEGDGLVRHGPASLCTRVSIALVYRPEAQRSRAGQAIARFFEESLRGKSPLSREVTGGGSRNPSPMRL
jgi:DNA-binding transcriptional LysR family regulator